MRAFLLTALCIHIGIISFSQIRDIKKIKVLSWNIYMLPRLISKVSSNERAAAIGDLLKYSDYDVIVFQEAFSGKSRQIILDRLLVSYPYATGPANQRSLSLKTNSGIWILSKYPITSSQSIIFKTRSGIDAFSRKGALMVELNVNGSPVQIIGTHLQNSGNIQIREAQCMELYNKMLVPNKRDGVSQIICGDFNIDKYSKKPNYNFMLQTLHAIDGSPADRANFSYDNVNNDLSEDRSLQPSLIDYILVANNGAWATCTNQKVTPFQKQWTPNHKDLSDHYSLEAEVNLNNESTADPAKPYASDVTLETANLATPRTVGIYVTPEYQVAHLANQYTNLTGASLSIQLNNKWDVGLGHVSTHDFKPQQISATNQLGFKMNVTNLKLEYTPNRKKAVHISFPLIIGLGEAKIDSSERSHNRTHNRLSHDSDKDVLGRTTFFMIQPGVNVEANIFKYAKIFMGISYRILPVDKDAIRINTPDQPQLRGMSLTVGLKVGIFNYSFKEHSKVKKDYHGS